MKRKLLCVLAMAFWLGACAHNTAGVTINAQGQVSTDGSALTRDISLSDARSMMTGGFLRASALITNQTTSDLDVQYKFTWYDVQGLVVEDSASPWIPLQLYGKARQQVQGVAPNATVAGFTLTVRPIYSQ
ncbi:YcfL family protein [Shewanella sp. GXUN23E]|uniref:YcfL family protein n=1 Tax=Shewanella sp. GXUN23E TaxID=3422498 RepID=UPI003D7D1234